MHLPDDEVKWLAMEEARLQRARPHVFLRKLKRRAGTYRPRPTHDAREMDVLTFASVYNAADFAVQCQVPLDTLVTLDLARMGVATGRDAQQEVIRFLKCYNDWADERLLPVAWIYGIEGKPGEPNVGLHAHIALHIPGNPVWEAKTPPGCQDRSRFREWARQYIARRLGASTPRVVHVSGSLRESPLRHWSAVTYLMKGYDRMALVQSARSSPDGQPIYLGDLIPWPYCNPGAVDLQQRIRVSHNLGPKQRAFGAPPRMEDLLPRRQNWAVFNIDRMTQMSLQEKLETRWTLVQPRPFQTLWEDGVRDVRKLYPADFYRYVTKQAPDEAPALAL